MHASMRLKDMFNTIVENAIHDLAVYEALNVPVDERQSSLLDMGGTETIDAGDGTSYLQMTVNGTQYRVKARKENVKQQTEGHNMSQLLNNLGVQPQATSAVIAPADAFGLGMRLCKMSYVPFDMPSETDAAFFQTSENLEERLLQNEARLNALEPLGGNFASVITK